MAPKDPIHPRVTDRLPPDGSRGGLAPPNDPPPEEPRVTDRLGDCAGNGPSRASAKAADDERVTLLLQPASLDLTPPGEASTGAGKAIQGRYLVMEGPLGKDTGEAEIYRCLDQTLNETVALKLYRAHLSPKREVMENLLHLCHPCLVELRDYGEWDGRFFEVLEYCRGGTIADIAPLSEAGLRELLPSVIAGLQFCHDQGIVHRDIKPSNILFRDEKKTQPVIGDFGISSFLPEGRGGRKTRTYMFFTIDYCPPEQLRLREVGPPADYYSLGVTLIHLLMGHSPFRGLSDDDIVDVHLQGKVPMPEGLSEPWRLLLKGLLRGSPRTRWGYGQVEAWLAGETILTEDGLPDTEEELSPGAGPPYPECPEATTPSQLARHLDDFDAARELFRGRISLWVRFFDPAAAGRIVEIEEQYSREPRLGLFRLRYILDPRLPLKLGGRDIHDIEELAAALRFRDRELWKAIQDAFWDGYIEEWIDAVFPSPEGRELARKVRDFRRKHTAFRPLGPLHLLFMIDPGAPLHLGENVRVTGPEELADVVGIGSPNVLRAMAAYLFSGQLAAWLEIAFPEHVGAPEFLNDCAARYRSDAALALQAVRWYFKPSTPLVFDNVEVTDPSRLAELIDASPRGRETGERLLVTGRLRAWLTATGMLRDTGALDEVMSSGHLSTEVKIEMILHLLDPHLQKPVLTADVAEIDFGEVPAGGSQTLPVEFSNAGRGHLTGHLFVVELDREVLLDPPNIEGPRTRVEVKASPPGWLNPGVVRKTVIVAESNGGGLEIPVCYRVTESLDGIVMEPDPPGFMERLLEAIGLGRR